MDHFNVPMLAESNYHSAAGNQQQQHSQTTTTHHHKDHMLAAGNAPATPYITYTMDKDNTNNNILPSTSSVAAAIGAGNDGDDQHPGCGGLIKSDYAEFTSCIQQSALLDHRSSVVVDANIDSLSGLCDLKFPSPNPHSVGVADVTTNNFRQLPILNNIEAKMVQQQAHSVVAAGNVETTTITTTPSSTVSVAYTVASATVVPSFTNLLFGGSSRASDSIVGIDPKLTQNCTNNSSEYMTLKTPTIAADSISTTTNYMQQTQQHEQLQHQQQQQQQLQIQAATMRTNAAATNQIDDATNMQSFNIASTTITKLQNNDCNEQNQKLNGVTILDINKYYAVSYNPIMTTAAATTTATATATASVTAATTTQAVAVAATTMPTPRDKLADNQITTTTAAVASVQLTNTAGNQHSSANINSNMIIINNSNSSSSSSSSNNNNNNNHNHNCSNSNNCNGGNNNARTTLHSIEELAASSCTSTSIITGVNRDSNSSSNNNTNSSNNNNKNRHNRKTKKNNNNRNNIVVSQVIDSSATIATTTTSTNNHNLSNLSSECDSLSSPEDNELIIDEQSGYQDTTSSHSQQSGGGGGGGGGGGSNAGGGSSSLSAVNAALLNGSIGGSGNGGGSGANSNAAGYMTLLPPNAASSSAAAHLAGAGLAGGGGGSIGSGGSGNSGSIGGANIGGGGSSSGTSATAGISGEAIDFKHLFEELCPVCGDKVSGYHYGLLTCESCKGFFKRTVQNKKVYTCVAERSCHIDKTQRKRCPYCRFQKCLEVGMKLEAVRADRMRGGRNKFGPMYKRDRARKLQVMRQRQLALQALRTSIGSADMKPTPLSPGYQQAYPNMNIKQEIQIPQISSLTQSPDSSPSPIAIALGQVNASTGGSVITTPMNGNSGGGSNSGGGISGSGSSSTSGGGGGGGSNNNNTGDIIQRGSSSSLHDAGGTGSLQTTAESKLCFDSSTHPSSTADSLIEPLRVSPMIRDFVQSIDDREWQTQLFALLQKQTYNQVEVDLFELMCKVLDQNLFSQVDWARNTVFFKDLKVDDQMKLLQHSWSDMLVLDHLHHRIHNGLPDETQLNNGQVFNLLSLGLLGVPQLSDFFNDLQNKLQDLKFDMGDYVCMKFLILLNPDVRGIINKKTVLEGHENVQAALLDYTLTCYPSVTDKFRRLLNILPEIHAMAVRGEDHLYSKHCAGSAPTQTLLMEMLHAKRKA